MEKQHNLNLPRHLHRMIRKNGFLGAMIDFMMRVTDPMSSTLWTLQVAKMNKTHRSCDVW